MGLSTAGARRSARRSFRSSSIAAAILIVAAGSTAAQELSGTQSTILSLMTVMATRSTTAVFNVPASVTVAGAGQIQKRVVRDIQDLVRYEPGVAVDRPTSLTNPFGQINAFSIRGVGGNRVQVLVDGSRVQERITDGSRDFVDPWNMEAVELVRGPNSVLWGSDALGGVVVFRTKDPEDLLQHTDNNWAAEFKTAFDSYDNSFRKQASFAWEDGPVQFLLSLGHQSADEPQAINGDLNGGIWGCRRADIWSCAAPFPADVNAYNALFKTVLTPSADHRFEFTVDTYVRNTVIQQIFDPSAISYTTSAGLLRPVPLVNYQNTDYDRVLDMNRTRIAVEHEWQVGAEWLDSVKWTLALAPQQRITTSNQIRTYSAVRTDTVYQLRDYSEFFKEFDLQLVSSADLGWSAHTFTYGFDGDITDTNYTGTNRTFRSDTGVTTTQQNQGFSFPRVTTRRADLYLQDEIKLLDERLTITPGVRLATYFIDPTVDPSYAGLPGYKPQPINSVTLLKKLSVAYDVTDEVMVYAAYGEGFKMPNAQQLFQSSLGIGATGLVNIVPNPDLQPESVTNYEIGLKGQFERGYVTVAGFYADYDNFIRGLQPVPGAPLDAFGDPTRFWSDNVESVQLYGLEVAGEYEVVENLFANANITYQRGTQQVSSGAAVTPFDGAVPFTAVLGTRYEMPEYGLEFELFGTFAAGPTERSDPNAFKPAGYTVFDAFAKWTPKDNIELTAGVLNIFDTKYFPNTLTGYAQTASIDVANQNPLEAQVAPGRTYKVGATVRF